MRSIATFPLAALCGLAMVASLFLKWFTVPPQFLAFVGVPGLSLGGGDDAAAVEIQTSFGPSDLLEIEGFSLEMLFQDPMGIAVAASFLIAAAIAILGFLAGSVPRLFAIIGGLLPFGIVGWGYLQAQDQIPAGVSVGDLFGGDGGITALFGEISPFLGYGLYAYFGGALLLLLLGLFSPSKRETY